MAERKGKTVKKDKLPKLKAGKQPYNKEERRLACAKRFGSGPKFEKCVKAAKLNPKSIKEKEGILGPIEPVDPGSA